MLQYLIVKLTVLLKLVIVGTKIEVDRSPNIIIIFSLKFKYLHLESGFDNNMNQV